MQPDNNPDVAGADQQPDQVPDQQPDQEPQEHQADQPQPQGPEAANQ